MIMVATSMPSGGSVLSADGCSSVRHRLNAAVVLGYHAVVELGSANAGVLCGAATVYVTAHPFAPFDVGLTAITKRRQKRLKSIS